MPNLGTEKARELGRRSALKRWGPARTARLSDFTPDERAFIHWLIDAAKVAKQAPGTPADESKARP